MRRLTVWAFAVALAAAAGAGAGADDKDKIDAKKLIGKWEPSGADAPKGATVVIEFTKDGKVFVSAEAGGKTSKLEADYKVDGNKLVITPKGMPEDVSTIVKLTDDELVTQDKGGKKETLKRIKAKDKPKEK